MDYYGGMIVVSGPSGTEHRIIYTSNDKALFDFHMNGKSAFGLKVLRNEWFDENRTLKEMGKTRI